MMCRKGKTLKDNRNHDGDGGAPMTSLNLLLLSFIHRLVIYFSDSTLLTTLPGPPLEETDCALEILAFPVFEKYLSYKSFKILQTATGQLSFTDSTFT